MVTWGDRLREERERVGITQNRLAQIGSISRPSQSTYENSSGSPSPTYWAAVSKIGIDPQYVLTGFRSTNWPPNSTTQREVSSFEALISELQSVSDKSNEALKLAKRMS